MKTLFFSSLLLIGNHALGADVAVKISVNGRPFNLVTDMLKVGDRIKVECRTDSSSYAQASFSHDKSNAASEYLKSSATMETVVRAEDGRRNGMLAAYCSASRDGKIADEQQTVNLMTETGPVKNPNPAKITSMRIIVNRPFDRNTDKLKVGDRIRVECRTYSGAYVQASVEHDRSRAASKYSKNSAFLETVVTTEDGQNIGSLPIYCSANRDGKIAEGQQVVNLMTETQKLTNPNPARVERMEVDIKSSKTGEDKPVAAPAANKPADASGGVTPE